MKILRSFLIVFITLAIFIPQSTLAIGEFVERKYSLLAGRAGTANDLHISTDAAGTMYGSAAADANLNINAGHATDPGSVVFGSNITGLTDAGVNYLTLIDPNMTISGNSDIVYLGVGDFGLTHPIIVNDHANQFIYGIADIGEWKQASGIGGDDGTASPSTIDIGNYTSFYAGRTISSNTGSVLNWTGMEIFADKTFLSPGSGTINHADRYRSFVSNPSFSAMTTPNFAMTSFYSAPGKATGTSTTFRGLDVVGTSVGSNPFIAIESNIGTTSASSRFLNSTGAAPSVHVGTFRIGDTTVATQKLEVMGNIKVDNNGATQGDIRFDEASGNHFRALRAPATLSGDKTFLLPDTGTDLVELAATDSTQELKNKTINVGIATTTHAAVQGNYVQTLRAGATYTCQGITDGQDGELCYEQDTDTLYACEPTAGLCNTAAEWRQIGGAGSGDVTDVGPGCTTGACLKDGTATTGTVLLDWEGTSIDEYDLVFTVPADPTAGSNYLALNGHLLIDDDGSPQDSAWITVADVAAPGSQVADGTDGTYGIVVEGQNGGATSSSSITNFGGDGGSNQFVGGIGGDATQGAKSGAGGNFFGYGSAGGQVFNAASGSIAGAGGASQLAGGQGGALSGTGPGTAGLGGPISLAAGHGGAASGAANTGGNGGNVYIDPGAAGTGTAGNGTPGSIRLAQTWNGPTYVGSGGLRIGGNTQPALANVLEVAGNQPASSATNGTAALGATDMLGGKGGNTSSTSTSHTAGTGGGITLVSGIGGDATNGANAGAGGTSHLEGGTGGAVANAVSGAVAGVGGTFDFGGGTGGDLSGTGPGTAGQGGYTSIWGGNGGAASGAGNTGGDGGNIYLDPGAGGVGSGGAANGNKGSTRIALGAPNGATFIGSGGLRVGDNSPSANPSDKLEVLGNALIDNASTANAVKFRENSGNGSNFRGLKAPATLADDKTYLLPDTGTDGVELVATDSTATLANKTIAGGLATTTHAAGANKLSLMRHATDCTAITDGVEGEPCYEVDADTIYVCEPTVGGEPCNTAGEWKATGGTPDLSGYLLLAGRATTTNDPTISTGAMGTIYGSNASEGGLTLLGTSHATHGEITLADKTTINTSGEHYHHLLLSTDFDNSTIPTGDYWGGVKFAGTMTQSTTAAQSIKYFIIGDPITVDQAVYNQSAGTIMTATNGFVYRGTTQSDGATLTAGTNNVFVDEARYKVINSGTISGVTHNSFWNVGVNVGAGVTLANVYGIHQSNVTGAGSVTNQEAIHCDDLTKGTTNACIGSAVSASGTARFFLNSTGTAPSALAGGLTLGASSVAPEGAGFLNFAAVAAGNCQSGDYYIQADSGSSKMKLCSNGTLVDPTAPTISVVHALSWFFPGTPATGVQAMRAVVPAGLTGCTITNSRLTVNTVAGSGTTTYNIQRCTTGSGSCTATQNIYTSDINTLGTGQSVAGGAPNNTTINADEAFRVNFVAMGTTPADFNVTMDYTCGN